MRPRYQVDVVVVDERLRDIGAEEVSRTARGETPALNICEGASAQVLR